MMRRLLALVIALATATPAWASSQIILAAGNTATSASATREHPLMASDAWEAAGATNQTPIASAGTLSKLYVSLSVAPDNGAGTQSYAFTLEINDTNTALTCTISEASTSCNDTSNTVSVSAGDLATWVAVPSGTPVAAIPHITVQFDGSTTKESILGGSGSGNNTATRFYPPHGNEGSGNTTEAVGSETLIPTGGSFKNLRIVKSDPGVGNTFVWTLRKNSADTALTCTITSGNTGCTDTSNSVTVAAGDAVSLSFTQTGTPTASTGRYAVTFVSDTEGEFILAASNTGNVSNAASVYDLVHMHENSAWNATETSADQLAQIMTIKAIYVELNASPGAGTSYTFNLRQNASSPGLSCQVSGTNTTCNGSATISISAADLLASESTPSGTPTARNPSIAYCGQIAAAAGTRRMFLISKEDSCVSRWPWSFCSSRN